MEVRNISNSRLVANLPPQLDPTQLLAQQSKLKFEREPAALVQFSPRDLSKSLEITAEQILDKINEALGPEYSVRSEEPSKYTPEATAEKIFDGVTSLFNAYQRQNPTLNDKELLDSFMTTVRGGIEQGYSDALETLEAIGAFSLEGVKEGVEQTRILLESKLSAFQAQATKESPEPETD